MNSCNHADQLIRENTMSLEQKIDKLTIAIEALTVAMTSGSIAAMSAGEVINELKETVGNVSTEKTSGKDTPAMKKINAEAKEKAIKESKERNEKKSQQQKPTESNANTDDNQEDSVKSVSADELKAACLTAARSAPDAKAKVKALLKAFDATVVKDVAESDRVTVLTRLEAGEF